MSKTKKHNIWDRKADGNKRQQRSFCRTAIIATAIFLVFLFIKRDSVFNWIESGINIRNQKKEMTLKKRTINEMESRLESLRNDRDSLEKFARETFHFAESGDDVYLNVQQ